MLGSFPLLSSEETNKPKICCSKKVNVTSEAFCPPYSLFVLFRPSVHLFSLQTRA